MKTLPQALALGTAQTVAWASSTYLPAILAQPIAAELGVSTASVFGAFSLSLVVMAIAGPPVGRGIDKAGGRGVLAVSSAVLAAGLVALGLASGAVMLYGAWLVQAQARYVPRVSEGAISESPPVAVRAV